MDMLLNGLVLKIAKKKLQFFWSNIYILFIMTTTTFFFLNTSIGYNIIIS